jgi:hypothetical protein
MEGLLTQSLVREISRRGDLTYVPFQGDLILEVNLLEVRDENIGFRYDRKKSGKLTKSVIPTESRAYALAEIRLIQTATQTTLLGPLRLTATVDFDHDFYESRGGINVFSLGQVTDLESARDAVQKPLYTELSRKIVEFIHECW